MTAPPDHSSASVQAQLAGMDAAIYWLADDFRWSRALHKHYGGRDGKCVERCGPWPCLQYRLADLAQAVQESRLRAAGHLGDAPFRYAIQQNAIETTTPLRAVTGPSQTASGVSGRSQSTHGKELRK